LVFPPFSPASNGFDEARATAVANQAQRSTGSRRHLVGASSRVLVAADAGDLHGKQPTGHFHHAGLEHLNDDEFNYHDEFSFGHLANGNTSRGATRA